MELATIPIENRYILYRPLLRRAFAGNQAMVDLVQRIANGQSLPDTPSTKDALTFLHATGFLDPDPPPPLPPDPAFQPTMAVLLLTSRCNLRCVYCYADGGSGPIKDLSLDIARTVIDRACENASALGRPRFDLGFHGGGEPVQVWETVQQAAAYARSRPIPSHISMVSNGVWTARQRGWVLDNLDSLNISFDGTAETQDRQRPLAARHGSFKAVMHTIRALDRAGFSFAIRMTATAPWGEQLARDVRFVCQETGCAAIQVEPAFNVRRGEHQGPTRQESEAFIEGFMEAFEIANQAGRHLTYSGARPWLLTQAFCTAPYGALVANPDGKLVACYEIAGGEHAMADMFTIGHIAGSDIVVDEGARSALVAALDRRRAGCRDCFCYWHCAGDCYPRALAAQPDLALDRSPRCYMNREITARMLLWYMTASGGVWQGQDIHPQQMQLMRAF